MRMNLLNLKAYFLKLVVSLVRILINPAKQIVIHALIKGMKTLEI
jgi:hypothetical protein